jgi:DNA end-binding protein Ku
VLVEEEEIAGIRPESTRVIEISHVVDASTVDPIYIERPYYLAPENKSAGSPFAVVREALDGKAGVGRLALHGREYLVAILPREDALLMYTLRTAGEVRQLKQIDELEYAHTKVKPEEVKLARQVLNSFETEADLSKFTDNYQQALREMLEAKGEAEPIAAEKGKPTKVVNLMDALRQSLDKVSKEKKRPARAAARKTARVVKHPSSKARRAS